MNVNVNRPKLYFLKVDVQACFDTIEQTKLLEILEEVISHEGYLTQRYGNVSVANGRVVRKYMRKAVPDGMSLDTLLMADEAYALTRRTSRLFDVRYTNGSVLAPYDLRRPGMAPKAILH